MRLDGTAVKLTEHAAPEHALNPAQADGVVMRGDKIDDVVSVDGDGVGHGLRDDRRPRMATWRTHGKLMLTRAME